MLYSDHASFTWHGSLSSLSESEWHAIAGDHPFLKYAWLDAFEQTGATSPETGWQPCHLVCHQAGQLLAAMPLYLKSHSYGEYVFDWSWADAYAQAGGAYYPKLISAIPFSPVTGPRILMHPDVLNPDVLAAAMLAQVRLFCEAQHLSGAHMLFPDDVSSHFCHGAGWLRRDAVQFRWENKGYPDWEAFLSGLTHDKRKKIRQERKKIAQQDIACHVLSGAEVSAALWDFFYDCYCSTYALHGSQPYLPLTFFTRIAEQMPEQLALFVATQQEVPVACSLCVYSNNVLYGRYWGAVKALSCLHFELCYYQPQMFCIARGIRYFEGGAQGAHKLARGFDPYPTHSYHYLQDVRLSQAVAAFLRREQTMVAAYVDELEERRPFKVSAAL